MSGPSHSPQRGSSLLEAVIAAGVLATMLAGVLPLVTVSARSASATRLDLLAAHLARQRLAQLQALSYVRSGAGVVGDGDTALDQPDAFTAGGPGLAASGPTPLERSAAPWVDWLDESGVWQASGEAAPPGAMFRRRWAILAAGGEGCLRLWVEVLPLRVTPSRGVVRNASLQCPWGGAAP